MKPIQTIETYTIDSKHYTLFGITYLLGGTLVLLFFAKKFHLPYLGVIGYIILFLSPLIFKKRFRKSFIKKTIIQFYSENFTIEQYNMNTNELESNDAYSFVQIISYKTYGSTKNDFSKLTLDMSDRTKIKYTFTEQANDGSETDVINIFRKQIHLYNEIKSNGKKIILKPNLFATRIGWYYIIGLTVLLISAIIVQIIYNPKTIPFSLLTGAILYLQILAQRKRDIENAKEE